MRGAAEQLPLPKNVWILENRLVCASRFVCTSLFSIGFAPTKTPSATFRSPSLSEGICRTCIDKKMYKHFCLYKPIYPSHLQKFLKRGVNFCPFRGKKRGEGAFFKKSLSPKKLYLALFRNAAGVCQHQLQAVLLIHSGGAGVIVDRHNVDVGISVL